MAYLGYEFQTLVFFTLLAVVFFNYLIFIWRKRDLFIKSWNCPGPLNFPFIGASYKVIGQPKYILDRLVSLHNRYEGSFKLWFGSRLVYFIHDPIQIETLLGGKNLDKDTNYRFIAEVLGPGLLTAPSSIWKRHRKHIAPTFNLKILNNFVEIFAEKSLILSRVLTRNCNKKFDVFHCMSRCTMDIVCQTAMGLQINAQEENSKYAKIFDEMMDLTMARVFLIWNHIDLIWKLQGYKGELDSREKTFNNLVDSVIQQKKRELEERRNNQSSSANSKEDTTKRLVFLDYLLQTGQLSDKEIRDEINIFLFAGTDTSAIALTFLLAVLGMYPDIQQKLYEEVVGVMGKDRMPGCDDLPLLVYTERVIKESLRLFPPGCFFLRAITEEVDMGDFVIPRGASAFMFVIYLHRDPKYWPDPLKFDPDRFLPEEVAKRHPCTYIPFSYGPRNCIGFRYAMMTMKTIISIIIRKFVIHSEYRTIDEIKVKANIILRFQDDPKVTVAPRI